MSDQRIFDQLDLLERGARDLHPPYRPVPVPEPVYEDSRPEHDRDYEEEPEHAFIDQPMQLDSFGETDITPPPPPPLLVTAFSHFRLTNDR